MVAAQEWIVRKGVFREFQYPSDMERTGGNLYDKVLSTFSTSFPNVKEHEFHFALKLYWWNQNGYTFADDERALVVFSDGGNTVDVLVTRYSMSFIPQIEAFFS